MEAACYCLEFCQTSLNQQIVQSEHNNQQAVRSHNGRGRGLAYEKSGDQAAERHPAPESNVINTHHPPAHLVADVHLH